MPTRQSFWNPINQAFDGPSDSSKHAQGPHQHDAQAEQLKRFDLLGKLCWLWMSSPLHRDWQQSLAARFLLPPVALGQYELIERDGMPVAYCSWAWLSAEAEMRYMVDSSMIQLSDWNGGDRLWFADWVAPFGAADSLALRRAVARRFPHEVARAIRVKPGKTNARVMEFKGAKLPNAIARERLRGYYGEFVQRVQRAPAAISVPSV